MDSCHQISPTNCNNRNTNSSKTFQVVVVLIPFPAQGHLNQLLHLSRLISSHNIPVHYVATASHIRQATLHAQGWDLNSISNIHFQDFKVPPFASPPPNPYNNAQTKFPSHLVPSLEACSHLRQPVASFLQSLSCVAKRVIVIHDSLMASVAQDAKNIANVENYTFHSTSAFNTSLYIWEEMGKSSLSSIEGLRIPKVPSLEGCIIPQFLDFVGAQYECLKFNDGNIFNTSRVIESSYLELMERVSDSKKIWALGPFIPLTIGKKSSKGKHLCMEWLDKQEPNSVIYVSFGTTTSFTREEIEQIAIGLEQSKQKFIWVLRDADKGDIFDMNEVKRHELPYGFEERVGGRGLILRDWAPQLEILSHPSTGGFMSHCGWNSCIESLTMGVPIASWPMHSDQPRNAIFITQVLKVGLVAKDWEHGDVLMTASAVKNVVTRLMDTKEGDEIRERAMELKMAIHRSMDEGGVSHVEMGSFIAHITR